MKNILLATLLFVISCTEPKQKTPQLKLKEVSIENITMDILKKDGWYISKGRRLYFPQYEDSGYHYVAEYCKDSLYNMVHFYVIKQDTFVFNYGNGKWYPQNLNLITKNTTHYETQN